VVAVLAATEYVKAPFPLPDAPDTTEIQLTALTAVHEQPLFAVTVAGKFPPAAPGVALKGLIVYVHCD
jgi:hypothetical protein